MLAPADLGQQLHTLTEGYAKNCTPSFLCWQTLPEIFLTAWTTSQFFGLIFNKKNVCDKFLFLSAKSRTFCLRTIKFNENSSLENAPDSSYILVHILRVMLSIILHAAWGQLQQVSLNIGQYRLGIIAYSDHRSSSPGSTRLVDIRLVDITIAKHEMCCCWQQKTHKQQMIVRRGMKSFWWLFCQ